MADPLGPLAWGPLPPLRSAGPEALKLGSLAILLAATLFCGLMPLRLFPPGSPALRRESLGLLGCLTSGVFLATCLLDLLPSYLGAIKGALEELRVTLLFPLPEFILSMGFFLVLILEQILLACKEPQEEEEKESKETLWSPSASTHKDPPSGLRLSALLLSLCLSSGLQASSVWVLELCPSLLLHQGLLAFALGLRLAQGGLWGRAVAAGVALFAASAPLGLVLGATLVREPVGPSSPLSHLSRSVLQGLAAGAFLYLSCTTEGLHHGTQSRTQRRQHILRAMALLAGFALLTSLLFLRL
ncbi:zinc transporter ZIP1 [Anolis carolinensis]|uniref:zinc transporter ZIP1 n=1 Tax=Anolis carolinensis TaxID=28377 RepID=UPI002F2B213E